MSKAWMPLFIGDYLGDTSHLTQGQHGAYILLLMHYWQCGPIPCDRMQCYSITRATDKQSRCNADAVLRYFFKEDNGYYRQPRADDELRKAQTSYERRAGAAGKRWAKAKQGSTSKADAMHVQAQYDSDSIESKTIPSKKGTRIPEDFKVTQEHRDWAKQWAKDNHCTMPSPDSEIAGFIDYWHGIPGQKGVKLDWDGTFRNWLRRALPTNGNGHVKQDRSKIVNPALEMQRQLDELRSRSDPDN
jgi:uncharacterized protein YdaU (DUF1376 family)